METDAPPSPVVTLAVAGPAVAAMLAVLAFSGLELLGSSPLSFGPVRNIAEAAGMGQSSEVLRLLAAGEDPNRVLPVREEVISSTIRHVTALEAAIWSHRVPLVELMDRQGAIRDSATRRYLACLAGDLPAEDIVEYLSAGGTGPDCVRGEALKSVAERSR